MALKSSKNWAKVNNYKTYNGFTYVWFQYSIVFKSGTKLILQWMQTVLEKQNICKSEETGSNDLASQSALNQKAFVLLCIHRCFSRDTPQWHDQLWSLSCKSLLFHILQFNPVWQIDAEEVQYCYLNMRCPFGDSENLLSLTLAVQLLQVHSAAHWSFPKTEATSAGSTCPYLTHKFFHSLHSMVGL